MVYCATMKARPKAAPKKEPRVPKAAKPRKPAPSKAREPKAATAKKAKPQAAAKRPAASKATHKTGRVATRYKLHEQIVYPLQGVGLIHTIEKRPFRDQTLLYYIIYLEVSDMTVMVPVDKADELGIRPIVGRKEAQKALALLAEEHEPVTADWKLRYQMNLELLKKGSTQDIATVVRTLYRRSTVKELPILERKLYDSALKLLIDETSLSLEKTKDEMEKLIFGQMGKRS
jgi:CarD family transcriptional regulator